MAKAKKKAKKKGKKGKKDPTSSKDAGDEPDDLVGRRLIYANAAARELFRTSRETGPLVTAVRDPKVLDADS